MSIHLDSPQQLAEILEDNKDKLIILDFYADWCGPCMALAPKLDTLAKVNDKVIVVKADADSDELEKLSTHYKISALPTIIMFYNKQIIDHFTGANESRIMGAVQKFSYSGPPQWLNDSDNDDYDDYDEYDEYDEPVQRTRSKNIKNGKGVYTQKHIRKTLRNLYK